MDYKHLVTAFRYVEQNPVQAVGVIKTGRVIARLIKSYPNRPTAKSIPTISLPQLSAAMKGGRSAPLTALIELVKSSLKNTPLIRRVLPYERDRINVPSFHAFKPHLREKTCGLAQIAGRQASPPTLT
jgi:hypothetical protein